MDIAKTLLRTQSRASMLKIVHYVNSDAKRFAALVKVFLAGPYRLSQRAAWPLGYCVEQQPQLIRPHLRKIVTHAQNAGVHPAVKRNTLRLLQFCEIPARQEGMVTTFAFACLRTRGEPVAVKVFAIYVLAGLARKHPALYPELRVAVEDQLPYQSAAFAVAARKVLRSSQGASTTLT